MLPNPTPYRFDKATFSPASLTQSFRPYLVEKNISVPAFITSHDFGGVDADTTTPQLLEMLHNALDDCNSFIGRMPRDTVLAVLRNHIQVVLDLLNHPPPPIPSTDRPGEEPSLVDLVDYLPQARDRPFLDVYFGIVWPGVLEQMTADLRWRRRISYLPQPVDAAGADTASENNEKRDAHEGMGRVNKGDSPGEVPERRDIWVALMFHMLCWLWLHDFHPSDLQISKSDMLGSRQPAYIN
jgi:hypothetical protein